MAIVELSIVPVGTGTPSISQYVATAVEALREETDVKYELTAMGTIIEGDLDKLLAVVGRMHRAVLAGALRVVTMVKIDDRRDKPLGIQYKVDSVKEKLKH